jgi:aspartate aminotransferase
MSFQPSVNVAQLRESATIAVSARAKALRAEGRQVIDLGAGEPDFPTPGYVVDAARRALEAGLTRYTQVEGILPLREVIAERATAHRPGTRFDPAAVVVSTGTKQALFNACFTLFGPGDEVLVPTPGWTSYYEMVGLARAAAIPVCGSPDAQFKITTADLSRTATSRTRGLILNSPCSPTGAVYSHGELTALARFADERGWWILSDEIYREISYEGEAPSLLSVAPDIERLVVVDGVAKSFAMTGWRIGWAVAPPEVARAMTALQSHTTSNAGTIAQHATLAALSDARAARETIDAMVGELRRRRDAALELLRGAGLGVIDPLGAFYLYIHIGSATPDDPAPGTSFARELLEASEVAVVPGAAFRSPEWIRASYAAPRDQVLEGVRRIIERRIS